MYEPSISLSDAHFVSIYSGIPMDRLLELDIYNYRVLLLNAIVYNMSQTKEGCEDLRVAGDMSKCETQMDTASMRELFG